MKTELRKAGRQSRLPVKKPDAYRNEILGVIAHSPTRIMAIGKDDSDAVKAIWLGVGIGQIGERLMSSKISSETPKIESQLIRVAAHAIGWIESKPNSPRDVFAAVIRERKRQNALLVAGAISFNCASAAVDAERKFTVLLEEGGEVANAILDIADKIKQPQDLIDELTQVAAVAVAWLESLEVKP